ncbi:TPA: HindIII family type II restriction endonuclease, partial [Streptococcus suis]|nr:HindIII family type II restriction endonuclease [Streptococcus suis]
MVYDLEKLVNDEFRKLEGTDLLTVDTEKVTEDFFNMLTEINDQDFVSILITSGYIPDLYGADSKEETLFTKLCEALEVNWATRMGFEAKTVTQKSSYEDVVIRINNKTI